MDASKIMMRVFKENKYYCKWKKKPEPNDLQNN